MAIKSYSQQLEEVQNAIAQIETGGQAYNVEMYGLTRANLKTLYDREQYLRKMVDREENGGIKIQYGIRV